MHYFLPQGDSHLRPNSVRYKTGAKGDQLGRGATFYESPTFEVGLAVWTGELLCILPCLPLAYRQKE